MKKWVRSGLLWGTALFLITMIAIPLIEGQKLSLIKIVAGLLLWLFTGYAIGYLFLKKSEKKASRRRVKK